MKYHIPDMDYVKILQSLWITNYIFAAFREKEDK